MNKEKSFAQELAELINRHGIDNDLNTPDWVLANLLVSTLNAQNELQVAAADGVRNDDPDDDDVCNCPACTLRRAMGRHKEQPVIWCAEDRYRKRRRCKRYVKRNPDEWVYTPAPYRRNCPLFIEYKQPER